MTEDAVVRCEDEKANHQQNQVNENLHRSERNSGSMLPPEACILEAPMTQSLRPLGSLFLTIVLATLAIALPILVVLSTRFLWDRNVNLGRSKELEKLIWQLHRIASAMEHQMNLSFPAVQPGTEEPRDLAYLQPAAAQATGATQATGAPPSRATASAAAPT